jgi:hypothetical protein
MKETFREYHQFDQKGIKELWKRGLFVFDTNTLLNMYRYSRDTVDEYIGVLSELKKRGQIWIPYQTGLEFYENRLEVISEYEDSYDVILDILAKAKTDIENKYKDHPFLDLSAISRDISKGVSGVESRIKQAKRDHPKWVKNDEMLKKINDLFEGATGERYDTSQLNALYKEGKQRYEEKIPPGYKDVKKPGNKAYGDFVLWCQILDHAKKVQKPIIFISGDIKEDWWLKKNGERIQPRPELKREMLDKADVDFHIYTADRFLEYYQSGGTKVDSETIKEVRKVRELEEKRESKAFDRRSTKTRVETYGEHRSNIFIHAAILDAIHDIESIIRADRIHPGVSEDILQVTTKIRELITVQGAGLLTYYAREKTTTLTRELLYLIDRAIDQSKDRMSAEAAKELYKSALRIARSTQQIGLND